MPLLTYDRAQVATALDNPATAEIAERLRQWTPTEDDDTVGRELLYRLITENPAPLWRLEVDQQHVTVLAHFSCDNEAFIIYDHTLTLSLMIEATFEVADTGIDTLADLVEFTDEHDGPTRVFAVFDAVTDRLDTVLSEMIQFTTAVLAPRYHGEPTAGAPKSAERPSSQRR